MKKLRNMSRYIPKEDNKAMLGSFISTGISTVGNIIASRQQNKIKKELYEKQYEFNKKLLENQEIINTNENIVNSINSILANSEYEDNDDYVKGLYKCGGNINNKRKKSLGGLLAFANLGGVAIDAMIDAGATWGNETGTRRVSFKPNPNKGMDNPFDNGSNNFNNPNINLADLNSYGLAAKGKNIKKPEKIEAEGGEIIRTPSYFTIEHKNNKDKANAIPLGNNMFFLRGDSHKNGGINIDIPYGEIYSKQPMFPDGTSPTQRVLAGENPDRVFNAQEFIKRVKGLNDDGSKTSKRKAKYGNFITNNYPFNPYETLLDELKVTANKQPITLQGLQDYNISDYNISSRLANDTKLKNNIDYLNQNYINSLLAQRYTKNTNNNNNLFTPTTGYIFDKPTKWGFVADLLPSLGNAFQGFTNLKLANSLASKEYKHYNITKPIIKVNGPSRIHIGAQLAENERARLREINNIAKNTSNSNVALARMQESNTKLDEERNKLWQFKYNKDTELQNELAKAQAAIDADFNKNYDSMMMQQYLEEQKLAQNRDETVANIKGAAYQNFGKGISNIGNSGNNYVNRGYQNYLNSLDMAYLYNSLDEKGRAVFKNIYGDYASKYSLRYQ